MRPPASLQAGAFAYKEHCFCGFLQQFGGIIFLSFACIRRAGMLQYRQGEIYEKYYFFVRFARCILRVSDCVGFKTPRYTEQSREIRKSGTGQGGRCIGSFKEAFSAVQIAVSSIQYGRGALYFYFKRNRCVVSFWHSAFFSRGRRSNFYRQFIGRNCRSVFSEYYCRHGRYPVGY